MMEYVPLVAAVGSGGYAGYRVGSSIRKNIMAYGKRKATGPNREGFRRKIRRKSAYGYGSRMSVPHYRPSPYQNRQLSMSNDRCIVALKDIRTHDLTQAVDALGVFQVADILTMPAFARYANLYSKFRIKKLKIEWLPNQMVSQILSFASQDDKSLTGVGADYCLKQRSCRFHAAKQHGDTKAGRTMNLAYIPLFNEFLNCDTASTTLSVANACAYDASIRYLIKHHDVGTNVNYKVECNLTMVVEFAFLQETTQCD